MGKRLRVCGVLALALNVTLGSSSALAAAIENNDVEYITYNGFDPIVNAFQMVAHIFAANTYLGLFSAAAVLGGLVGGYALYLRGLGGGRGGTAAWMVPALAGIAIYTGLFVPKGNVHVHDQVLNRDAVIAGVPKGVMWVSAGLNALERIAVETIEAATTPGPGRAFSSTAGGSPFSVLLAALQPLARDAYVVQNVNNYIEDCVLFELNRPGTDLKLNDMIHNSVDVTTDLAKANNLAVFTTFHTDAAPGGATRTCGEAWTALQPVLTGAALRDQLVTEACAKAGFDVTQALQKAQCKGLLANIIQETTGVATTADAFASQVYLAQAIYGNFVEHGLGTAMGTEVNRQTTTAGIGALAAANEWLPMMKAGMVAVAIGLIPVLALFLPTPVVGRALLAMLGFFIWTACWGVTDAIMHSFIMDFALRAFEGFSVSKTAIASIINFPNPAMKALALFGSMRMTGLTLASFLSMILIKFGGHALVSTIGGLMTSVQQGAQRAAELAKTEGLASALQAQVSAAGTLAVHNGNGFGAMMAAGVAQQEYGIGQWGPQGIGAGGNARLLGEDAGAMTAEQTRGGYHAYGGNRDLMADVAQKGGQQHISGTLGAADFYADENGQIGANGMRAMRSDALKRTGDSATSARASYDGSGGNWDRLRGARTLGAERTMRGDEQWGQARDALARNLNRSREDVGNWMAGLGHWLQGATIKGHGGIDPLLANTESGEKLRAAEMSSYRGESMESNVGTFRANQTMSTIAGLGALLNAGKRAGLFGAGATLKTMLDAMSRSGAFVGKNGEQISARAATDGTTTFEARRTDEHGRWREGTFSMGADGRVSGVETIQEKGVGTLSVSWGNGEIAAVNGIRMDNVDSAANYTRGRSASNEDGRLVSSGASYVESGGSTKRDSTTKSESDRKSKSEADGMDSATKHRYGHRAEVKESETEGSRSQASLSGGLGASAGASISKTAKAAGAGAAGGAAAPGTTQGTSANLGANARIGVDGAITAYGDKDKTVAESQSGELSKETGRTQRRNEEHAHTRERTAAESGELSASRTGSRTGSETVTGGERSAKTEGASELATANRMTSAVLGLARDEKPGFDELRPEDKIDAIFSAMHRMNDLATGNQTDLRVLGDDLRPAIRGSAEALGTTRLENAGEGTNAQTARAGLEEVKRGVRPAEQAAEAATSDNRMPAVPKAASGSKGTGPAPRERGHTRASGGGTHPTSSAGPAPRGGGPSPKEGVGVVSSHGLGSAPRPGAHGQTPSAGDKGEHRDVPGSHTAAGRLGEIDAEAIEASHNLGRYVQGNLRGDRDDVTWNVAGRGWRDLKEAGRASGEALGLADKPGTPKLENGQMQSGHGTVVPGNGGKGRTKGATRK